MRLRNLGRTWPYLRPYYRRMAWLFLMAAASTATAIAVPMIIQRVVDGPLLRGDPAGLAWLCLLVLGLGCAEAALVLLRRWAHSELALGMETALRRDLFAHLQRLPVAFHRKWQLGQLLSRATTDLGVIRKFMTFGSIFIVINTGMYLTVLGLLIEMYWPLGLVVAAGTVPLLVTAKRFSSKYLVASRTLQDQQGDLAALVEESANGIQVTRAFGRHLAMLHRFAGAARLVHDTAVAKSRLNAATRAQFEVIPNLLLCLVLSIGSAAVATGAMTIGELVAFVSLQVMLVWPLDILGWIIAIGQESMTACDRLYEVLDAPTTIVECPGAVAVEPATVRGHLRFEAVRFGYPDGTGDVLEHVDLEVRPGETVALVGATGCGKSALAALVPRLYDVTGGRITIDGRDLREYTLSSLREIVAMVFDDPTLFSTSVRENLTIGRPQATEVEITQALEIAQAGFVHRLPEGLDTPIGERGHGLSGGQRQRIALARAMICRPRVLVLDDPLSALDVHTEAKVEQSLARMLRRTTALVVATRLSTVAMADRVAMLRDGRIVAVGTNAWMLANCPGYRTVLSAAEGPAQ